MNKTAPTSPPWLDELQGKRQQLCKLYAQNGEESEIEDLAQYMLGWVSFALLRQDEELISNLSAELATLLPIADERPTTARERWESVVELLEAVLSASKPVEQQRLANPKFLSGKVLWAIYQQEGVSRQELLLNLAPLRNNGSLLSNQLKLLDDAGLIDRIPFAIEKGRSVRLYLTIHGRQMLDELQRLEEQEQAPARRRAAETVALAARSEREQNLSNNSSGLTHGRDRISGNYSSLQLFHAGGHATP